MVDEKFRYVKNSLCMGVVYSVFMVFFFFTGCGSPQGELFTIVDGTMVWPKPPDAARIRYVGELSVETDLKKGVSWSEGLVQLVFGKKDIGVLVGPYAVAVDGERMFVADAGCGVVRGGSW